MNLSDESFAAVQALLLSSAGIALNSTKKQMAMNRLNRPMREAGYQTIDDYITHVRTNPLALQKFLNAMTTNVTSFFREAHHLTHFVKTQERNISNLRIWSAGCSTGQEPYSILMALGTVDATALLARTTPLILATDIDTQALETAKRGVYTNTSLASIPKDVVLRVFQPFSATEMQVRQHWRKLVEFRTLNLSDPKDRFPKKEMHAIFCRNVMIYFKPDLQRRLVENFCDSLTSGGYLYAGHSEMLLHSDSLLRPLGQTVYQVRN
jgi:chemotaxis protein methyltransferase CheR